MKYLQDQCLRPGRKNQKRTPYPPPHNGLKLSQTKRSSIAKLLRPEDPQELHPKPAYKLLFRSSKTNHYLPIPWSSGKILMLSDLSLMSLLYWKNPLRSEEHTSEL